MGTIRINLETPRLPGYPVVKRGAIGETFNGAVIKSKSRDRLKRNDIGLMEPIINPRTGKNSQELVVTCLALPGTTASVGLGKDEDAYVPEPGTIVRLILKGKAFGDWIEAKKSLPEGTVAVGDVVTHTTTTAQVYDAQGGKSGDLITDQSLVDQARSKGRTIGIYGPLTLRPPKEGSEWVEKAVAAYRSLQERVPVEDGPLPSDEPPFGYDSEDEPPF